ncbi:hypothetical protein NEUTE2DRAFT_102190 [Neurospora tetrasperma FGSC 2509]|nr:hypothetical protein NEUTE2DRAFT_102190 [Neurospora tetrasperma FGSC 2509]
MASSSHRPFKLPLGPLSRSNNGDHSSESDYPGGRRDSMAALSISSHVNQEQLAHTLDRIHNTASQSGVLTTFNDFAPPPPPTVPVAEKKGTTGDLVQQGLSGLYSRLKEVVGVAGKPSVQEAESSTNTQDATPKNLKSPIPNSPNNSSTKISVASPPKGDGSSIKSPFDTKSPFDAKSPFEARHAFDGPASLEIPTAVSTGTSPISPTTIPADLQSPPQTARPPSLGTLPSLKTGNSSAQTIPRTGRTSQSTAASPTVAPFMGKGSLERDSSRGPARHLDEPSSWGSSRRSISRHGDGSTSPSIAVRPSVDTTTAALARSRMEDAVSIDGGIGSPMSPSGPIPDVCISSASSRLSEATQVKRRPAIIDRISQSRVHSHSRSSSMEPGKAQPSPISTSAHSTIYHDSFTHNVKPQRLQSGAMKIPGTTTNEGAPEVVNARLEMMRKQVLSKEFWMKDETTKECFACGSPFTAFRRKHHCRTCGCIFCSKCTSTISGQKFGVQGTLRVCKNCLEVINRRYESGSDDSADEPFLPAIFRSNQAKPPPLALARPQADDEVSIAERTEQANDTRSAKTPMMAIPATRRVGDSNRHSAVLEIDMPQLSRPGSSRSLRSLAAGRPQSSSHRRLHSKHTFLTRFKSSATDDRAPFRKPASEDLGRKSKLSAFHDDNIIDPELAPYMSDESTDDEQMSSIFATMNSNDAPAASLDPDKTSMGAFMNAANRKHRFRHGEKSISGLSYTSRGHEDTGLPTLSLHTRPTRKRNLSTASVTGHPLRSPRPRSGIFSMMLNPGASADALSLWDNPGVVEASALSRRDSYFEGRSSAGGLNPISMNHVKKLFRQLLNDAEIPNPAAWEKALIPILDKCADDVDPDVRNGDDMDIRHWIKLKKIPGGKPGDTAYVHGVVFSKNLALKTMPRKIENPKIVIITFPIEYQRHQEQHFMSLQPVIEQEKEYLRMVVNRILNLEPRVLLVEKNVSGVALQYLSEAEVAVVYNVKPSVIEAVSRIANIPIISSMDMLSLGARVGTCQSFEVKTFVNKELKGRKKTYIFISGCPKERGCTIALRGGSTEILSRMKRITEFMVYVVYNLKLESCLMRDEFVFVPEELESPPRSTTKLLSNGSQDPSSATPSAQTGKKSPHSVIHHISEHDQSLEPSQATARPVGSITSAEEHSAAALDTSSSIKEETEEELLRAESETHESQSAENLPMPTYYGDMVAKYETRILSASPFVKFTQPYLLMKAREQERRLVYLKRLRDQDIVEELGESEKSEPQPRQFQLIKPEMVHELGQKAPRHIMEVLHAVHDAEYDKALYNYQTQTRQWENYIQGSLDLFDPYSHQSIVILYSVTCNVTQVPCTEPSVVAFEFYKENPDPLSGMYQDCTLGQYIEDVCESADSICHSNGCDRKMFEHYQTYVHENARITVMVEDKPKWPENFPEKPHERDGWQDGTGICMWNYCKLCNKHFGLMPMSVSTWKYSFAKYLELSFWSRGLRLHPETGCPHDHKKDHVRFFYYLYRDIAVRIHYDPIDLYEIIVPRSRITWKVDHDLELKNQVFLKAEERWNRFINSVKARLKSIRIDSVLPEKTEHCKAEVERMTKKAQEDQAELIQDLQDAYMGSKYYEVLPMNGVIRQMAERATEWDVAFTKFEADFLSDKDVRQLTIIQLKKMFDPKSGSSGAELGEKPEITHSHVNASEIEVKEKTSQPTEDEGPSPKTHSPVSSATKPIPVVREEAVEEAGSILDGVEHLDLATASSPTLLRKGDPVLEAAKVTVNEPTPIVAPAAPTQQPTSLSKVNEAPHESSLAEMMEPKRREQHVAMPEATTHAAGGEGSMEGYRPIVPERTSSRKAGLALSPPLTRAISQPVGVIPKLQSAIPKAKEHKMSEPGDLARATGDGSSAKGDKKFLGMKIRPSAIPRYRHRNSKVFTLARHFEELSREFEKERIKDKRERQAKMSFPRAYLPRSTTKAIVEIYEDVDQAVQEPGTAEEGHPGDKDSKDRRPIEGSSPSDQIQGDSARLSADHGRTSSIEIPSQEHTHQDGNHEAEGDEEQHESEADSDGEGADSDADRSSYTYDDIPTDVRDLAASIEPSEEIPEELPKHQRKSLMTMLTNFWAERSASGWPTLDYPYNSTDHMFTDSNVIVREDEPSSVVAFAMNSTDYHIQLRNIRRNSRRTQQQQQSQRQQKEQQQEPASQDFEESSDSGMLEIKSGGAGPDLSEAELEQSMLRPFGTHLKFQFMEGSGKFTCKIFFAEQFDALRRKCGVGDRIVESLSRCLKWDSKGGKTKSVFLKTLDDRLVMKSLSPVETSAFLGFAPVYFEFMAQALFHELPSVIAKMLGFFQVIIKNPITNTEVKLDLLLMENLFYDRSPTRTFDLKGSMRNRKIQSTGEQNEVLLDENMVEYIWESPLFAREHSKRLLRASVWNDTLFLARQNVMDYSLMIAVEENKKELVVGMIDCIRTWTWDKRLESWIKDRGFAGGGRNRPTVTSPKEYKSRFREAMARYILQAPNCWHHFGSGLGSTGNPSLQAVGHAPRARFAGDVTPSSGRGSVRGSVRGME